MLFQTKNSNGRAKALSFPLKLHQEWICLLPMQAPDPLAGAGSVPNAAPGGQQLHLDFPQPLNEWWVNQGSEAHRQAEAVSFRLVKGSK